MDDFLNKLKARTENLRLFNHEGVDQDALWANIEKEIGEVETKKTRGFIFFLPFLFLLFFIGSVGLYFNKNTEERVNMDNQDTTPQNSIVELPLNQSTSFCNDDDKQSQLGKKAKNILIKKPTEKLIPELSLTVEHPNFQFNIPDNDMASTSIVAVKKESKGSFFESSAELQNSNQQISTNKEMAVDESTKVINPKNQLNNSLDEKPSLKAKEKNVLLLTSDTIHLIEPFLIQPSSNSTLGENYVNKIYNRTKRKKISIGLFSGTHLLYSNYRSTNSGNQEREQLLNSGFKSQLGYSVSAEIIFNLTDKIKITSGIEYVYSINQFNYSTAWDTTFQSPQNPNIIVNRMFKRNVIHHNRHSIFSIPILLGTDIRNGRLALGINLGVGLNFTLSQKGKSLGDDLEVLEFPNAENSLSPIPEFFFSYHLCPYLNYQLSRNLKFQLRSNFKYQNYGTSDFYKEMGYSSILTGLQAGIIVDLIK